MNENNNKRPIFIVGCERSGTTMLRLILCSHKNIAIPPQTKFIKKLYKRRFIFSDLSKEKNRNKLKNWFFNNHDKKTKLIDLDIGKNEIQNGLEVAGNTIGAYLASIFKLYSLNNNKVRWGDKHPYYIKYLPQLFKLFPDAQVIHLVRDGRDSVASLKKMPWWKRNSIHAMLNWQEAIQKGVQAKKEYSSDQFMEIHYEDIIDKPEHSIKLLCNFLYEEYSSDLLKFYKIADRLIPSYKMDWHSGAKREINSKSIGRWENDLEDWEISLINKKLKKELALHKYDISLSKNKISFAMYSKYFTTKIQYKTNQYGTAIIELIMHIFYRWDLDYRK